MNLLVEENHDLPVVQVTCVAREGSAGDPPGKEGRADMAAELALRGAAGRDRAAFAEAVDALGGSLDAETSPDSVRLTGRVLARNLDPFLDLMADALRRPSLPPDELARLKVEMHGDLDDLRDDDHALASRFHARAVYLSTPYAKPPDGTHESLDRIDREDCAGFLGERFGAADVLLGTAGALSMDEAHRKLETRLGPVEPTAPIGGETGDRGPATREKRPRTRDQGPGIGAAASRDPEGDGRRLVLVDKPERTQVQLLLGHVALPLAHPDALPLQVALTAFGGMFSSPLMQEVRVKRGWSYGTGAWLEPRRGPGAVAVYLFPANEQAPDALRLVLDLIGELAARGVEPALLDLAKRFLVHSFTMDLDTPEKRIARRLAVDVFGLPSDHLTTYRRRVEAVTPETSSAALARHLHPDALVVTAVATASRSLDDLARASGAAQVERHNYEDY